MNLGIIAGSIVFVCVWLLVVFVAYTDWKKVKREAKMKLYEKILIKFLFALFIIVVIVMPVLFGKMIYNERFRTARACVGLGVYDIQSQDCDKACINQCKNSDSYYVSFESHDECECICIDTAWNCIFCNRSREINTKEVSKWLRRAK